LWLSTKIKATIYEFISYRLCCMDTEIIVKYLLTTMKPSKNYTGQSHSISSSYFTGASFRSWLSFVMITYHPTSDSLNNLNN
jgi:hypothetical protein